MMGVTKIEFRCGTVMDAVLTDQESKFKFAHCPTKCPTCGKQHGSEMFTILEKNIKL